MPDRGTERRVRSGPRARTTRLRRAVLGAGALALIGTSAVLLAGNASAAEVSASFSQSSSGGGVHVSTYVIENTSGKTLDGWRLTFEMPRNATMGAYWNGLVTRSGQRMTVANREFNGKLAPGGKTEFGFVQYGDGEPVNCRINGKACGAGTPGPAPQPKPTPPAPKPTPPAPKPTPPAPKPTPGNPSSFGRFTPYIDTSLGGGTDFDGVAKASGAKFLNLAFIVSGGGCTPTWGGSVGLDDPVRGQEINALRALGGDVRVSFGGAASQELGLTCGSVDQLAAAYQSVIDRYRLTHVDFDIEGGATSQVESVKRRNQAIRKLQDGARAKGRQLFVSYTLPVLPTGLLADSVALVEDAAKAGVDIEAVNIMAMDYGAGVSKGQPMGGLAVQAANSTADQLKGALGGGSASAALRKIAVTPMIGVNDVAAEVFKQDDARTVVAFAQEKKLAWLGFWSMGRDNGGCAGSGFAQATCSSLQQGQFEFAKIFGGFTG